MSLFRRQTPRVLAWQPMPGQPLPDPVIADDRASLPSAVVRDILAWLDALRPQFERSGPTPIVLTMDRPINGHAPATPTRLRVQYGVGAPNRQRMNTAFAEFKASTVELHLKNKRHAPIEATYTYLAARDQRGHCVVGPQLRVQQKELIILAAGELCH